MRHPNVAPQADNPDMLCLELAELEDVEASERRPGTTSAGRASGGR